MNKVCTHISPISGLTAITITFALRIPGYQTHTCFLCGEVKKVWIEFPNWLVKRIQMNSPNTLEKYV